MSVRVVGRSVRSGWNSPPSKKYGCATAWRRRRQHDHREDERLPTCCGKADTQQRRQQQRRQQQRQRQQHAAAAAAVAVTGVQADLCDADRALSGADEVPLHLQRPVRQPCQGRGADERSELWEADTWPAERGDLVRTPIEDPAERVGQAAVGRAARADGPASRAGHAAVVGVHTQPHAVTLLSQGAAELSLFTWAAAVAARAHRPWHRPRHRSSAWHLGVVHYLGRCDVLRRCSRSKVKIFSKFSAVHVRARRADRDLPSAGPAPRRNNPGNKAGPAVATVTQWTMAAR